MSRTNKILIYLLISGVIAIAIGANLKINGNANSVYSLASGLILELIAVIGLIAVNFSQRISIATNYPKGRRKNN